MNANSNYKRSQLQTTQQSIALRCHIAAFVTHPVTNAGRCKICMGRLVGAGVSEHDTKDDIRSFIRRCCSSQLIHL